MTVSEGGGTCHMASESHVHGHHLGAQISRRLLPSQYSAPAIWHLFMRQDIRASAMKLLSSALHRKRLVLLVLHVCTFDPDSVCAVFSHTNSCVRAHNAPAYNHRHAY